MAEQAGAGITIVRVFAAPRERVWREWTEPEAFADWFGGVDAKVPLDSVSMDVRPGGAWTLTMLVDGSQEILWHGAYLEVEPPERLVFTVADQPEPDWYELVTVDLSELEDGTTEMRFSQRGGMAPEAYEHAGEGWSTFFDRIDARLAGG